MLLARVALLPRAGLRRGPLLSTRRAPLLAAKASHSSAVAPAQVRGRRRNAGSFERNLLATDPADDARKVVLDGRRCRPRGRRIDATRGRSRGAPRRAQLCRGKLGRGRRAHGAGSDHFSERKRSVNLKPQMKDAARLFPNLPSAATGAARFDPRSVAPPPTAGTASPATPADPSTSPRNGTARCSPAGS